MGPKLNLIYLCDFICEFNSEYIKRRRMCISLRWYFFFDSLFVSGFFFMILAKFVFFCQMISSEGHFWNFEMVGNRQTQKKILKNCTKRYVLKTYLLKYALKLTGRAHFDLWCFLFVLSEEYKKPVVKSRQTEKIWKQKSKSSGVRGQPPHDP